MPDFNVVFTVFEKVEISDAKIMDFCFPATLEEVTILDSLRRSVLFMIGYNTRWNPVIEMYTGEIPDQCKAVSCVNLRTFLKERVRSIHLSSPEFH